MPRLPRSPVAPAEFLERFVPKAFAELELSDAVRDLEVRLGVHLHGEQGGEWLLALAGGELTVEPRAAGAGVTLVQSVADFHGALWHGRGGPFGRRVAGFLAADGRTASPPLPAAGGGWPARALAALGEVEALEGRVALLMTDGEGDRGGDWRLDLAFGAGHLRDEPNTTVRLSVVDADALEAGALNPLEALMAGRVQVSGDVGFMVQMQSILMRLASD